jgi:hypothetical protein
MAYEWQAAPRSHDIQELTVQDGSIAFIKTLTGTPLQLVKIARGMITLSRSIPQNVSDINL